MQIIDPKICSETVIYSPTPELYSEVAAHLCSRIGGLAYFSGSVVFTFEGMDCRLTTSVIVYRAEVKAPDGVSHPIADLIPLWWEFHTVAEGGEVLNDFSFGEMKAFLP